MRVEFRQYIFDFKNMYFYASFNLRMNHAGIIRNAGPNYKRPERSPNLELINFHEMRYSKGMLLVWDSQPEIQAWVRVFPNADYLHKELVAMYHDYLVEEFLLGTR